jgi:serine/threonine protein kinase
MSVSEDLFRLAEQLESKEGLFKDPQFMEPLDKLEAAATQIGKSWCGSWLGYHSCVYYADLQPSPPGAHFSQEWGLTDSFLKHSTGEWREYAFDDVVKAVFLLGGDPDIGGCKKVSTDIRELFEESQAKVLSLVSQAVQARERDGFLKGLEQELQKQRVLSEADIVRSLLPKGQRMSRDVIAISKGYQTPPHIHVLAIIVSIRQPIAACVTVGKLARRIASHLATQLRMPANQHVRTRERTVVVKSSSTSVFETAFDKYTLIGPIGAGGSGTVVKVKAQDSNAYALKYISPEHMTTDKLRRFKNELGFCARNGHANIIKVIDWGFIVTNKKKCPFYVMPFYSTTLRDLMRNGLPKGKVLPLFMRILDGVEAAHMQRIWHRDLKPENILCDTTRDDLVVADFGIAHFEEDFLLTTVETKANDRLANFVYASPEQRSKGIEVDHRADIFALGMILNEMFTGSAPLGQGYKIVGDAAPEYGYLDELVFQMLKQKPEERPSCIDDIKKQLLAKGNAFVTRQKLAALRDTVIPKTEVDDPLVTQPVQLQNFDYQNGTLILKLSKPVNPTWLDCFKQIPHVLDLGSTWLNREHPPDKFTFKGDLSEVWIESSAKPQVVQGVVDSLKTYLTEATEAYRVRLVESQRKQEEEEKTRLQREMAEQERREAILREVKL